MINKTKKQSNSIFNSTLKLKAIAKQLNKLTNSFYNINNKIITNKLIDIAYSIEIESKVIKKINKDNKSQRLQESQETIGKLMNLTTKLYNL
jgi:hypothetical protein